MHERGGRAQPSCYSCQPVLAPLLAPPNRIRHGRSAQRPSRSAARSRCHSTLAIASHRRKALRSQGLLVNGPGRLPRQKWPRYLLLLGPAPPPLWRLKKSGWLLRWLRSLTANCHDTTALLAGKRTRAPSTTEVASIFTSLRSRTPAPLAVEKVWVVTPSARLSRRRLRRFVLRCRRPAAMLHAATTPCRDTRVVRFPCRSWAYPPGRDFVLLRSGGSSQRAVKHGGPTLGLSSQPQTPRGKQGKSALGKALA
jgi:hypothetical protein